MNRIMKSIQMLSLGLLLAIFMPLGANADAIKVTVNETPITDTQISQRAKLLQLERRGASASARLVMAREELIDEALKIQEAERLGLSVSASDVDAALLDVARNMRISSDNLNRILAQNGVNPATLRARLRANIAWGKVVRGVVASRIEFSEADLEQRATEQLTEVDNIDYILKEILFIIPQGSNISSARRTAQANQYRQSFQGCDSAVEMSLSYTDAAVLDMGRRHATQLPDAIADELAGLNVGQLTAPRVVANGVSMLAVCSKTVARDVTFVTNEIRQEVGTEKLGEEADKYLAELRDKASIVNR